MGLAQLSSLDYVTFSLRVLNRIMCIVLCVDNKLLHLLFFFFFIVPALQYIQANAYYNGSTFHCISGSHDYYTLQM